MKKTPAWKIVVWCVLMALAIVVVFAGIALKWPGMLTALISLVCGIPCIVWMVVHFTGRRRTGVRRKSAFIGNQAVFGRVLKETEEAVARYLDSVTRKGFMKKSALYERPWFLLLGPRHAGKSSLLRGSGLHFPVRYPSEKDGLDVDGSTQVRWYFANEAVWLDTPGVMSAETGKDEWQALIAALKRVRPLNPLDGMAIVVNADEVLNADDRGVKELARTLRARIDEVIAMWGIEFPVYLLLNHTDKIPGFTQYFGQDVREQEQIFGATLAQEQAGMMPRLVFAEEFRRLCASLTDRRLDKLHKERLEANKRLVCRFVIHFEGMQEKIGALITELFKHSNYEGRPIFRGFYFTSCQVLRGGDVAGEPESRQLGATIVNHPLNPRRAQASASSMPEKKNKAPEILSLFVLPLFREIMVQDKSLVTATQKRTRQSLLRHYLLGAAMLGIVALAAAVMIPARNRTTRILEKIDADMQSLVKARPETLVDHYAALDILRRNVALLEQRRRAVVKVSFGFDKSENVLRELKKAYFARLRILVCVPVVKYLEYDIGNRSVSYGELGGNDYEMLYRALKSYLSISETAAERFEVVDTGYLRPVMKEALTYSLVATMKAPRLPQKLETIVSDNIGMYLYYLKNREFPLIQQNQRLTATARKSLRRLPGASNIYATVMNRLTADAPQISLDAMLGRQGEGIYKSSRTISTLYTQEGWNQFVSDAINEASKDPFTIDWVVGLTRDQVPESMLDVEKLRSDMIAAYIEDFNAQWQGFLAAITIDPFGDLARSSRILQKIVAERSELSILLETVADYTVLKQEEEGGGGVAAEALSAAAKMKIKPAAKAQTLGRKAGASFSLGRRTPMDELDGTFNVLRSFARSTGGALSGYEGYRDKIMSLVGTLNNIEAQGDDHAVVVFNGREDDPLLAAWNYTQNTLASMPPGLASALRELLVLPLTYTGDAASRVLSASLDNRWKSNIVKPFTVRFTGRYPFSARGEEASFDDVMDFFRPSTGTFWGFYERTLSSFIVKTSDDWRMQSPGSLRLEFNPALVKCLANAERIRDIFFKQNGEPRMLSITITPAATNNNSAVLEVNGQEVALVPGGKSGQFGWPIASSGAGAVLKIAVENNYTQDIRYDGKWGFMKLLQAARINSINKSTIMATWQANVQNMYMIYQKHRIQVAGSDHPFADPVFSEFDCPTDLMGKSAPRSSAAPPVM